MTTPPITDDFNPPAGSSPPVTDAELMQAEAPPTEPAADLTPLESIGLQVARQNLNQAVNALDSIDPELVDLIEGHLKRALTRAKAAGSIDGEDAVTTELAALNAARHFKRELKKIGERAQARQRLLAKDPAR